jgi:hypothetical protein
LLFSGTTIHLQTEGLSLLDATVSVFNSQGRLVASTTATNPTSNDLTLDLNNLSWLSKYYVEVSSPNGGVFDVGTYNLTITNNLVSTIDDVLGGVLGLLGDVGHTLADATNLVANTVGLDAEVNYNARASLNSGNQTDVYSVAAPASSTGGTLTMVADVWTLGNQNLTPQIEVFDSQNNPVAFQVLTESSGANIIQVTNAVAGQKYKLEVKSASGQTGSYSLAVSYLSSPVQFPMNATGSLNASAPSASANLEIDQSQVMHFVLSTGVVPGDTNTLLEMTIVDSNGNTVATLQAMAGNSASLDIFLGVGTYTVTVTESTSDGSALQGVDFNLSAIGVTDPVGPTPSNPTSTPSGSSGSTSNSSSSSSSSTSSSSTATTTAKWTSTTPTGNSTWN